MQVSVQDVPSAEMFDILCAFGGQDSISWNGFAGVALAGLCIGSHKFSRFDCFEALILRAAGYLPNPV